MNEWNVVKATHENRRLQRSASGTGDRNGRLPGGGGAIRNRAGEPWVTACAIPLLRPAQGSRSPAGGLTSRRGCSALPPTHPALLAGAGKVSPDNVHKELRLAGPQARCHPPGPALPPPPPGKSPLTPLPPSSPPSSGASKTTEFAAAGLAGPTVASGFRWRRRRGRGLGGSRRPSAPSSRWPEGWRRRVGGLRSRFRPGLSGRLQGCGPVTLRPLEVQAFSRH
jgi:hypothetical protein